MLHRCVYMLHTRMLHTYTLLQMHACNDNNKISVPFLDKNPGAKSPLGIYLKPKVLLYV